MGDFVFGVNLVLPLFIVILVGVILREKKIFGDETVNAITTFVYYVALPAKLFADTISIDFTKAFDYKFVLYAIVGSLLSFLVLLIIVPIFVKDRKKISAMVHAGFRGNFVFVGIPLVENILNKSPVVPTSLVIVFVVPLYTFLAVGFLTYFNKNSDEFKLSKLLFETFTNPLIFTILFALPFSIFRVEFPSFVGSSLSLLSRSSTPLALLLIGASLRLETFKGDSLKIILVAIYKTIFQPILFVPLAIRLGFSVDAVVTIFVLFSVPCANNVYIMTKKLGGDAELASSITVISLIITLVTLPVGIFLLARAGII